MDLFKKAGVGRMVETCVMCDLPRSQSGQIDSLFFCFNHEQVAAGSVREVFWVEDRASWKAAKIREGRE